MNSHPADHAKTISTIQAYNIRRICIREKPTEATHTSLMQRMQKEEGRRGGLYFVANYDFSLLVLFSFNSQPAHLASIHSIHNHGHFQHYQCSNDKEACKWKTVPTISLNVVSQVII